MLILGINDSHDASVCLLRDGKIIFAAMEERYQRVKNVGTFPQEAVEACFRESGVSASDIDHVAFASQTVHPLNLFNTVGTFSVADYVRMQEEYFRPRLYEGKEPKFSEVFPEYQPNGDMKYDLSRIPFAPNGEIPPAELEKTTPFRREYVEKNFGIPGEKIGFYDHHRSHAYQAYYLSPQREGRVIALTSDGGGDGAYTTVHLVEDGIFTEIQRARDSLIGKIYGAITLLLGMHPHRHPYKVMGLAPYASEHTKIGPREVFLKSHWVEGLNFARDPAMQDHFFYFRDRLRTFRFDGIAGGLQDFVEARLSEWFRNIHEETGARHFAFGGGVANNVKSNLAISELEFVDSLFVPPGPGDDGLPVGAAFCAYYDLLGPEAASRDIAVPGNAYWGTTVDDKALADFDEHPILRERYEKHPDVSSSQLAEILRNGDIIALCFGQMEFGARALGHRSLIADPSNIAAMRRLNDLIKKRDFWMPFTPSILSERFDDYMIVPPNIDATYMTIGFESTALGREHLRAAIHPYDHTVRPQRVTQSVCPIYYSIIKEFERLTGIGAVLNTSLNIHEKPIVLRPTDIIDEIIEGGDISLPYLFVGGHLYVLKS